MIFFTGTRDHKARIVIVVVVILIIIWEPLYNTNGERGTEKYSICKYTASGMTHPTGDIRWILSFQLIKWLTFINNVFISAGAIKRITCEDNSLLKSSCSFSTCLRASPYIDAALAKTLSFMFSAPYLQQSSDNLVPKYHMNYKWWA